MRFICLGYWDEATWNTLTEEEQKGFVDSCLAYDAELRRGGHFVGGEALQGPAAAATIRFENRKIAVTDGPYAETKEQLGGILILEARDLNHAIGLMAKHPGVRGGAFEIRPADEAFMAMAEARIAEIS